MVIETRETTAFNVGIFYLQRINQILSANYAEFRNHNAAGFAKNLRQLYREVAPWLKENEMQEIQEEFDILSKIPRTDPDALWGQLESVEMDLRVHLKQLGMLMPKTHDPRFLFSRQK